MSTVKKNITEDEDPKPVLAYSKSKCQNELDIKNNQIIYIKIRLSIWLFVRYNETRYNA